jgi:hypothetical protein
MAYQHNNKDPNLNNLHHAMRYNASDEPQVRVHVDGISLEGDVIVDRVKLWDGINDLLFDTTVDDDEPSPTVVLPTENHNMVFNGSTWDRMRGTIADGVLTQISNDRIAISKDTNANAADNPIYVNVTNGTITIAEPVTVDGTVTVNQGTDPWNVTGNINATIDGTVSVAGMNPDAFGRQRVSELFTLGDYKHIYAIDPNFLDYTANGGTVSFDANQACAILATTSATNSAAW